MVLYNVENISKKPKMPKNYKISDVCKEGQISSKCLISFAECLISCHNIRICSKMEGIICLMYKCTHITKIVFSPFPIHSSCPKYQTSDVVTLALKWKQAVKLQKCHCGQVQQVGPSNSLFIHNIIQ